MRTTRSATRAAYIDELQSAYRSGDLEAALPTARPGLPTALLSALFPQLFEPEAPPQ